MERRGKSTKINHSCQLPRARHVEVYPGLPSLCMYEGSESEESRVKEDRKETSNYHVNHFEVAASRKHSPIGLQQTFQKPTAFSPPPHDRNEVISLERVYGVLASTSAKALAAAQ